MSFYLHKFLFLLFTRADGFSDGADLTEDGLRLLELEAIWAVGHLLVNPGGQSGEGEAGKETRDEGQFARRFRKNVNSSQSSCQNVHSFMVSCSGQTWENKASVSKI